MEPASDMKLSRKYLRVSAISLQSSRIAGNRVLHPGLGGRKSILNPLHICHTHRSAIEHPSAVQSHLNPLPSQDLLELENGRIDRARTVLHKDGLERVEDLFTQ